MRSFSRAVPGVVLALAAAVACGGGGGAAGGGEDVAPSDGGASSSSSSSSGSSGADGAIAPAPPSTLAITATAKLALRLGETGKLDVTVARERASGAVRVVAKGLPADATVAALDLAPGVSTGTLDVVTLANGVGGAKAIELVATTKGDDGKDLEAKAPVALTLSGLPGALDKGFGAGTGIVSAVTSRVLDVAVQADGKIVALGDSWIARFLPDGTPDTAFGDQGKRTLPGSGNSVALQADDKAVVAGRVFETGYPIFAARYDALGTLDATFGTAGVKKTELGGNDSASDVTLDASGRALVGGFTGGVNGGIQVVRYTTGGQPDGTWGSSGIATIGGGGTAVRSITVLPDGKVLVSGTSGLFGAQRSVALVRLTSGGGLDGTFTAEYRRGFGNALAVRPDGKALVVGPTDGSPSDLQLLRFTTEGQLDTTFGSGGAVVEDHGNTSDAMSGIALQADGKILVVGRSGVVPGGGGNVQDACAIVRFLEGGGRDTTFGTNGRVDLPGASGALFEAVVIQPDGKILAAGSAGLVRFWP